MLLLIQNDPEVPAGTYADFMKGAGVAFEVVKPFTGEAIPVVTDISAVIVLGGSMSVHDDEKHSFLIAVKDYLRQLVLVGKPYLGICLGGQLLANVLGAAVHTNANGEIGVHHVKLTAKGAEDPLFQSLPQRFVTFQWHHDSFAIPEGAENLCFSSICSNQAFRFGTNMYGLQFHPEVDEQMIASWCNEVNSQDVSPKDIVRKFKACEADYRCVSIRILQNFLKIAGILS